LRQEAGDCEGRLLSCCLASRKAEFRSQNPEARMKGVEPLSVFILTPEFWILDSVL
jgi:hypothetical protein